MSSPLNVYFDASVLGIAQHDLSARSGVFRVVEALFSRLLNEKEIRLRLTATEGLEVKRYVLQYLEGLPPSRAYALPPRSFLAKGYGLLQTARESVGNRRDIVTRGANQLLWKAMRSLSRFDVVLPPARETAVFHSNFWPIPSSLQRERNIRSVLTVHDLWEIMSRSGSEPGPLDRILKSLPSGGWAICVSHKTREDFLNYRPDIDPQKVVVAHLGVDLRFSPQSSEAVKAARTRIGVGDYPYFLSTGTFSERKNLPIILEAFARGAQANALDSSRLVLVGAREDQLVRAIDQAPSLKKCRDRVIATGYLEDGLLPALYSGAVAFLYPSLYEGFGIPILESMACRTPVLGADSGSLPEVMGNAGRLLSPRDPDAWSEAMQKILTDTAEREKLVQEGEARVRQFSWDRFTESILGLYRQALSA